MLIAQITPINILNKQGVYLGCRVKSYDLVSKCSVIYYIFSSTGDILLSESETIDSTVVSTWGTNDKVIIEAVAQSKGLTILNYPTTAPF